MLSDTFQRVEDLEATGVLTSSLQDKHVVRATLPPSMLFAD